MSLRGPDRALLDADIAGTVEDGGGLVGDLGGGHFGVRELCMFGVRGRWVQIRTRWLYSGTKGRRQEASDRHTGTGDKRFRPLFSNNSSHI